MNSFRSRFLLGLLITICLSALTACQIGAPEQIVRLPINDRGLRAVANFGQQRSGRSCNTFYFPTNTNLGDELVIYWKEENVLFSFPSNVTEKAVANPSLVVQHIRELNEKSFRSPSDREASTSSYLESWQQAVKWLRDAVVDGHKLVLESQPHSTNVVSKT